MTVDGLIGRLIFEVANGSISLNDKIISLGHGCKSDGIEMKQYHLLVIKSSDNEEEKFLEIMEE